MNILTTSWTHPAGANFSEACAIITTNPGQPGAAFFVSTTGPAVSPNQNVSGVLNPNGQADFRVAILNVGQYTFTVTVRSTANVERTAAASVIVTSANSTCPTVPAS